MSGSSLLLLIDDIATILDDVSALSKVAVKKTSGVLGDDLAVNAEQVSGVSADRELPVVWAVAKGSFRNKFILVPAALLISAFIPWLITPVLMLGGLFLCYEGFEKLAHSTKDRKSEKAAQHRAVNAQLADPKVNPLELERRKIKGAIRTDFILSAEIIVITLGIVAHAVFSTQVIVVSGIALLMTIGVYGLVAGIIKLDDVGLYLSRRKGQGNGLSLLRWFGLRLVAFAPVLMKTLAIVGTAAMFMVGGGILAHGLPPVAALFDSLVALSAGVAALGPVLDALGFTLLSAVLGVIAGALTMALLTAGQALRTAVSGNSN